MANTQSLKRRIKTAKNIKQITKAMEMVAASKMRRAQAQALSSRPYARKLQETLQTIGSLTEPGQHPLLQTNEEGIDIVVLVSTDKSLAGSLNTNLFRGTLHVLENLPRQKNIQLVIVGQKARRFAVTSGYELYAEFSNLADPVRFEDASSISDMLMKGYLNQEFRTVHIIYMDFISTLTQKMRHLQLLPASTDWQEMVSEPDEAVDIARKDFATYIFEPSAKEILDWLLPYYIELSVYQILLEARASEHSARMVAMKNASDNAGEIIADLTLSFNKQRQAQITAELLDNVSASMSVKKV